MQLIPTHLLCLVFQFKIQVESDQGGSKDDTALNSICLECNNGMEICSTKGFYGSWATSTESADGFSAADYKEEAKASDVSGGNDFAMYSQGTNSFSEHKATGASIPGWGTWRGKQYCRTGARICAIQTKVQKQHSGDNIGLNGVRLYCCANVVSVKVNLDALFEIEGGGDNGSSYTVSKQVSVGLISSSQIDQATSFSVAASMSASVSWGAFSATAGLEASYAKSAFSSALSSRQEKTTSTTSWVLRFAGPLYVYQGRTTVYMSDGGSFELAGDVIHQSDSRLNVTNIEVLQ